MSAPAPSTEAARFFRHELLEAPQRAVADADAAITAANTAVRSAEQQHQDARTALNRLFQRAIAGEQVAFTDITETNRAISDADGLIRFLHQVLRERERLATEARQRLSVVEAGLWKNVLDGGIYRRIDAAAAADQVLLANAVEPNAPPMEVIAAEAPHQARTSRGASAVPARHRFDAGVISPWSCTAQRGPSGGISGHGIIRAQALGLPAPGTDPCRSLIRPGSGCCSSHRCR
jgi:hypothetical protein